MNQQNLGRSRFCNQIMYCRGIQCSTVFHPLLYFMYNRIPIVRPCIGFLRGGPISEGPQKIELIFAAYSIRHDDAAFLGGQVPVPLVLGRCYPYSIFLRIACQLHRIIRLFRRHETRFNVFFVCLTDLTCTQFYFLWPSSSDD